MTKNERENYSLDSSLYPIFSVSLSFFSFLHYLSSTCSPISCPSDFFYSSFFLGSRNVSWLCCSCRKHFSLSLSHTHTHTSFNLSSILPLDSLLPSLLLFLSSHSLSLSLSLSLISFLLFPISNFLSGGFPKFYTVSPPSISTNLNISQAVIQVKQI